MRRIGFKMQLHPGQVAEYKRRHDEIWPELAKLLSDSGVRDYTIFHDPQTDILFAIHDMTEGDLADIAGHPVMRRWFAHMGDIMATNADGSPAVQPLDEVFHLD